MSEEGYSVEDWYDGEAVSYVHLAEGINPDVVKVEGSTNLTVEPCTYSTEYNTFHEGTVMKIHFKGYIKTIITR